MSFKNIVNKMIKAKKFVIAKHFEGEPKPSDLKLTEENLPPITDGEVLVKAEYLSVDPYMRPYMLQFPLGFTMIGGQVGKIIESKNSDYPVGKRIFGYFGWRTHTIFNPRAPEKFKTIDQEPYLLPDIGDLSPSLGLGILGMPGNTAYFGLIKLCSPKRGETLVVSGAAGAVGSHVGQIAKNIYGLNVIGIAGSDEKCNWIVNELGFDSAINYKTQNVSLELKKVAPKGVDVYFDNVGGDISSNVIYQMNPFGRIAVCGSISSYNTDHSTLPKCTLLQPAMVFNQLKMEGFVVTRWNDQWQEGIKQNLQWINEGKIKSKETITKGFENMFHAFYEMMKGQNIGKAIVQV
ncbi:PREDICTED: prostaglandin reductase 1-like [Polistes dominula]|uniref:Prostaglandin reductase 1 n=1 Tax=Polistes dominula TaxID=743375 RepID=A0ABM1IID7_POLDO|nr:PREDICTED: prostaglandin reductase 1-like [Polistes dominula]